MVLRRIQFVQEPEEFVQYNKAQGVALYGESMKAFRDLQQISRSEKYLLDSAISTRSNGYKSSENLDWKQVPNHL